MKRLFFLMLMLGICFSLVGQDNLEDYPRVAEKIARLTKELTLTPDQKGKITTILLDEESNLDEARMDAENDQAVIEVFLKQEIAVNEKIMGVLSAEQKDLFQGIVQPELPDDERLQKTREAVMLTPEQAGQFQKTFAEMRPPRPEGQPGGQGRPGEGGARRRPGSPDPERRAAMQARWRESNEKLAMLLIPEQQILFEKLQEERRKEMQERFRNREMPPRPQ